MVMVGVVAFAGVVVCGLLFIIMGLKDGPWQFPAIGMAVCFALVLASAFLVNRGPSSPTADQSPEPSAAESRDVEDSGEGETKESAEPASESEPPAESKPGSSKNEYGIGETWTVDGQWSLTITGVTETQERNQYSDKTPEAVYIIDYTYTNIGYEKSYSDGLFMSIDETIVDSAGKMGTTYPGNYTKHAQETPIGATCDAQTCIGVENPGDFKLTVSKYDGNEVRQSAIFTVTVG